MNRTRTGMTMAGLLQSWALLVALTLATMLLGAQELTGGHGLPFGMAGVAAVLAFALVKGRRILTHYMELRHAHSAWRTGLTVYLTVIGALILLLHAAGALGWLPTH
jgi:hypothetical protein